MKKLPLLLIAVSLLSLPTLLSAQESTTVGSACTSGQNRTDWDTLMQCASGTWKRGSYYLGAATASNGTTLGCTATSAGLMQWTGTSFQGCDGTGWKTLGTGGGGSIDPFVFKFLYMDASYLYTTTDVITGVSGSTSVQISPATYEVRVESGAWTAGSTTITDQQNIGFRIPLLSTSTPTITIGSTSQTISTSPSYIYIDQASYGDCYCNNCESGNGTAWARSYCNGTQSCNLSPSNAIFGDTCGGRTKWLYTYYYCLPLFLYGTARRTIYIQENTTGTISCP